MSSRFLLVTLLISANMLFAMVLSVALWQSRQQADELQLRTSQNLALAIERNISGTFDKIDVVLQGVVDQIEAQLAQGEAGQFDHQRMTEVMGRLGKRMPEVDVLRYADADGAITPNSGYPTGNEAASVYDRDYFQALQNNSALGMVTSKPVYGRTSKKWLIAFARRVNRANGQFAGVVYAGVTLDHFTDTFRQLDLGSQGAVTMIDPSHSIIARYPPPPNPETLGKKIPQIDLIDLMKANMPTFSRVFQASTDGVERTYSFHRLSQRPYYVAVGQGTEESLREWWHHALWAFAAFLGFFGITTLGTIQLMRSWRQQSDAHEEITQEKNRYRELNEQLESRVDDRTRELQSANAELRQALEHLGKSEKMAALGSLVAGVAHELNTPIGNLRLAASTYKDKIAEFSAEMARGNVRRSTMTNFLADGEEMVRLLDRNAERAGEMISSFKAVAIDQSSNRRRPFDLQQTVNDVVSTLRQKLKRAHCEVQLSIGPEVMLDSYPGALMQVMANLVENALLHAFEGRDGGNISISLDRSSDTDVVIRFSDDGKGIDPESADRIFEPFYSTKIGQGGSGLGLHLVRELAAAPLGGEITLDREVKRGASFLIRLPRTAPSNAEQAL